MALPGLSFSSGPEISSAQTGPFESNTYFEFSDPQAGGVGLENAQPLAPLGVISKPANYVAILVLLGLAGAGVIYLIHKKT